MTVTEVNTQVRRKYNAVGSTFFSDAEIYDLMYQGCLEMSQRSLNIEGLSTATSTVIGTISYNFPTRAISIKRINYNGSKLQPIDFREDDLVTGSNYATTSTGTPRYYFVWNNVIYLRPVPDAVQVLQIYYFKEPAAITALTTLEIPSMWHMGLVDFCVSEMAAKDKSFDVAAFYGVKWQTTLRDAIAWEKRKNRKDGLAGSKDDDVMFSTILDRI